MENVEGLDALGADAVPSRIAREVRVKNARVDVPMTLAGVRNAPCMNSCERVSEAKSG